MTILALAWFLIVTCGLGASLARWLPEPQAFLSRHLARFALGLGALPILTVLLDTFRVPLAWWVVMWIAVALPLAMGIRARFAPGAAPAAARRRAPRRAGGPPGRASLPIAGALLCAVALFATYVFGAYQYPHLEDRDAWTNAASASVVSIEKTARLDRARLPDHPLYLPPYPPGYASVMGMLHQIDTSMLRTLKVFNALLVASSILFFFLFAAELLGDGKRALLATLLLAVNPSFLSHFIWATSLAVPLCLVAWWLTERGRDHRGYFVLAGVVVASVLVTSRSVSVMFGLMSVAYWAASLAHDLSRREARWLPRAAWFAAPPLLGALLSVALLWAWIPPTALPGAAQVAGVSAQKDLSYAGTMTPEVIFEKVFTLRDFIVSPVPNRIDQPYGWGAVLTLLVGLGLVATIAGWRSVASRYRGLVILGMFAVTLLGVEGGALPYRIGYPHRFWACLAIPASLLACEGAAALWQRLGRRRSVRVATASALGLLLIATAAVPKYGVETSFWPVEPAMWSSPEELLGYQYLRTLPRNQMIFGDCAGSDYKIIGFDQTAPFWREDVRAFRTRFATATIDEIDTFLRAHHFRYVVIDGESAGRLGEGAATELFERLRRRYRVAHARRGFVLLDVR